MLGTVVTRLDPRIHALDFAELRLSHPVPQSSTLRKWRTQVPKQLELGIQIVLDRNTLRQWGTNELASKAGAVAMSDDAWGSLLGQRDALQTRSLTLLLDRTCQPTSAVIHALRALVPKLKHEGFSALQWCPSGLWEAKVARKLGEELDVGTYHDPLQLSESDRAAWTHGRVTMLGQQKRLSDAQLLRLADWLLDGALGALTQPHDHMDHAADAYDEAMYEEDSDSHRDRDRDSDDDQHEGDVDEALQDRVCPAGVAESSPGEAFADEDRLAGSTPSVETAHVETKTPSASIPPQAKRLLIESERAMPNIKRLRAMLEEAAEFVTPVDARS